MNGTMPDIISSSLRFLLGKKRSIYIISFILIFLLILILPTPRGLTVEGQRAIAVFTICLLFWMSAVIPLQITSLLAIVLLPLLKIMESREAYALFGNKAVFFILGAFILAAAVISSGLSTRLALLFLNRFGNSPFQLLVTLFLVPAVFSLFISEHAVAAMIFPIVLEIARVLRLKPMESSYGKAIFIAPAWGCIIGGVGTFLGGARNPLAVEILYESTGNYIGFFEWMMAAIPIVIINLVLAFLVLNIFFKIDVKNIEAAKKNLEKRIKALGKMSFREKQISVIMIATVFCWMFLSKMLGIANIAIFAVVVIFVFKLVKWKDVEENVNWGIILMYGGAICLGFALEKSGAALWVANLFVGNYITGSFWLFIIIAGVSLYLTEGISNSAVVAIMMPLAISLSKQFGIDSRVITFAVAIPSGLAFCLPMSTPATAIAYSSGYINVRDMIVPGFILTVISLINVIVVSKIYWPLIGLVY